MTKRNLTITSAELAELLLLTNDRQVLSYVRDGLLPKPIKSPYGETVFDRQAVMRILGVKSEPNEPFIDSHEVAKMLGVDYKGVANYCKYHKIPFYFIKNQKGSANLFLRSEVLGALEYTMKWDAGFPDFVARNHFLRNTLEHLFCDSILKGLKEQEAIALKKVFLEKKTLQETGNEMNYTNQGIHRLIRIASKKIYYRMQRLKEDLLLAERVMEQNYKLKSENTILLKKLQVGNTQTGIEPAIADEITMLAIPLDELDITVRMRSLFYAMGAKTLGDIADRKREDLLKYRNAGEKTAREVDYLLRSHGLWYRKSLMQIKMTDPVPEKLEKEATKEVTNRERIKAKLQRKIERMDKAHAWTYIEPKTKFQEMLNERKISHHKIAFLANVQLPQIIKLSGGLIQPHARTTSRICNALSVPIISTDIFKPKE